MYKTQILIFTMLCFLISCEKEIIDSEYTNEQLPSASLVTSNDSDNCFNFREFEFIQENIITVKTENDVLYAEYVLSPTSELPRFILDSQVNESVSFTYRLIKAYYPDGSTSQYFKAISGKTKESIEHLAYVTVNNIPTQFSGEIFIFDAENSDFIEAKSYENGTRTALYQSASGPCHDPINSLSSIDTPQKGSGCITIYYEVPRITSRVVTTDWWQIGGDEIVYLGETTSYESFPSVFLETYIFCPDGINEFIPEGDDGGLTQEIELHTRCLEFAAKLLDNGFHDPCQPDIPGGLIIKEALGGNWANCSSPDELLENLNNYLGNGGANEVEFNEDELATLMELPDEIACTLTSLTEAELNQFLVLNEGPGDPIVLSEALNDCFNDPSIEDAFVDCVFNPNQYNLTIYVDQPNPGQRDPFTGNIINKNIDVGHTFISLTESNGSNNKTKVFGLYPLGGVTPLSPEVNQAYHDDGGHTYDISVSFDLDCDEFNDVLSEIGNLENQNYNLNDNNCTDFGLNIMNIIECCQADSQGSWYIGGGSNPGDFGEDLRNYNGDGIINSNGGIAPYSTSCN